LTLQAGVNGVALLCVHSVRQFQGDLIAGIAVGLTVVPQSLAYAKIAELPPQVCSSSLLLLFSETAYLCQRNLLTVSLL